jgi:hypothetical protein
MKDYDLITSDVHITPEGIAEAVKTLNDGGGITLWACQGRRHGHSFDRGGYHDRRNRIGGSDLRRRAGTD